MTITSSRHWCAEKNHTAVRWSELASHNSCDCCRVRALEPNLEQGALDNNVAAKAK
jgi:hypothetical protein